MMSVLCLHRWRVQKKAVRASVSAKNWRGLDYAHRLSSQMTASQHLHEEAETSSLDTGICWPSAGRQLWHGLQTRTQMRCKRLSQCVSEDGGDLCVVYVRNMFIIKLILAALWLWIKMKVICTIWFCKIVT